MAARSKSSNRDRDRLPRLPVRLDLDRALFGWLQADAIERAVERVLRELLAALGLPALPAVVVKRQWGEDGAPPIRAQVDGARCRHRDGLFREVYESIGRLLPGAPPDREALRDWLHDDAARAIRFVAACALEMVKTRPSILLTPDVLAAYVRRLPGRAPQDLDLARLQLGLGAALDCWLSLLDTKAVRAHLARLADPSGADDGEALIAALRPDVVELHMALPTLQALTTHATEGDAGLFSLMRDGLYYENGVSYPSFRFVASDAVPEGSLAIRCNALLTLPIPLLKPDQGFVFAIPEVLARLELPAQPTLHPYQRLPGSLVARAHLPRAEAAGLPAYTPFAYMIMRLSVVLRIHAAHFVDTRLAADVLNQLELAEPVPVAALRESTPLADFTRVLRALAAEGVSIRDVRQIVEAVLNADYIVVGAGRIAFDERLQLSAPPNSPRDPTLLLAYVRSALRRQMTYRSTAGEATLNAFLVTPETEAKATAGPLPEPEQLALLDALRKELAALPAVPVRPVLLTTLEVRAALREAIHPERAEVPVLAYQELMPDTSITPLARLGG